MEQKQRPKSLGALLWQINAEGITGYPRYKMVRNFLDTKAREKGVPILGSFELTPLCNLDCKMCYVHLNRGQMGDRPLLTTQQWKSIMNQAVEAGMLYAQLTGGECLTYPGFKELYLHLRSMGVETSILSNGILMNEKMTDFLKKNRPAAIQISLYGASEEGYERVTGQRCFHTVIDNIKRLLDAQFPVSVVTTPNEFMTDGEQIVDLMHSLNLPVLINSGLSAPRAETGRELHDANLDTYVAMMKHQKMLSGEDMEEMMNPEELPDTGGMGEKVFGVSCGAGRSCFAVDWQGGMKPCGNFPCETKNVLEAGFTEAWRYTHITAVEFPCPQECQGCRYQDICKHCVAEHAAGAPLGHASSKVCAWGQRMAAENLRKLPNAKGGEE